MTKRTRRELEKWGQMEMLLDFKEELNKKKEEETSK